MPQKLANIIDRLTSA